jgi:hypothetical protein
MTFKIHKPEVRLFPVLCRNGGCSERNSLKFLPFKDTAGGWKRERIASDKCEKCGEFLRTLDLVHLLIPNENGSVHGSLETSPGSFTEHPIKRWEFACERSMEAYNSSSEEDLDYPRSMTVVPTATTCYECLERLTDLEGEEMDKRMAYFKTKE